MKDNVEINDLSTLFDFAERGNSRLPVSVICNLDFKYKEEILRQVGKYFQEF